MSDIEVSTTAERILVSFAGREAATVDDVLALARSLPSELAVSGIVRQNGPAIAATPAPSSNLTPAVAIENSVKEDYVVCLCCGKEFTMLKRHLKAEHGLTEEEYRTTFGLDEDHPLVAPSYSQRRAQYAKQIGLGKYARPQLAANRARPTA